jgi:NCAIR mutase (PurE)-related protein
MTVWLVHIDIDSKTDRCSYSFVIEVCKTKEKAKEIAKTFLKTEEYEKLITRHNEEELNIYIREREVKE